MHSHSTNMIISKFTPNATLAKNGVFALHSGKIMFETEDKQKIVWDPQFQTQHEEKKEDTVSKSDQFHLDHKIRLHLQTNIKKYNGMYVKSINALSNEEFLVVYGNRTFVFIEDEKGLHIKQKIKNASYWFKCAALSSNEFVLSTDHHIIQRWQRRDKHNPFTLSQSLDLANYIVPPKKKEKCQIDMIPLSPTTILYTQIIYGPQNTDSKQFLFKIDINNGQLLNKINLLDGRRIQQFHALPDRNSFFCIAHNHGKKEASILDASTMAEYPISIPVNQYYFCHSVSENGQAIFIEGSNDYDSFEVQGNIDVYEFPHIKKFQQAINLQLIEPQVFSAMDFYFPKVLIKMIMDYLNNNVEVQLTHEDRMKFEIHPSIFYGKR